MERDFRADMIEQFYGGEEALKVARQEKPDVIAHERCQVIRKVLLADDDERVLALVEATLTTDRIVEIYSARDGEQAIQIARQVEPDVIFLDVMMPKKNGYEVCRELKRDPATADIAVVMLTGASQQYGRGKTLLEIGVAGDYLRRLFHEIGADDYIAKPFSRAELLHVFDVNDAVIAELLTSYKIPNLDVLQYKTPCKAQTKQPQGYVVSVLVSSAPRYQGVLY